MANPIIDMHFNRQTTHDVTVCLFVEAIEKY